MGVSVGMAWLLTDVGSPLWEVLFPKLGVMLNIIVQSEESYPRASKLGPMQLFTSISATARRWQAIGSHKDSPP